MNEQICKGLTFDDCELAILRMAVDKAEHKIGRRVVNSPDVKKIIQIVEQFIQDKQLICYGGTAINNILPENDRFYNKDVEIPDYDFFSKQALEHAKELADIYYTHGFTQVEAKSGQHFGTYKVFVNFIGVADITYLPNEIFNALKKDAIQVSHILYAPPNFLRMSMYLELSRPAGDISRWEKVLKRLKLLNKHYEISDNEQCNKIEIQRTMAKFDKQKLVYNLLKNELIREGVVFFGGFANRLYSRYMPKHMQKKVKQIADFDVLSNDPKKTMNAMKEMLSRHDISDVQTIKHNPIGEIVPEHYELKIDEDTVLFVYKPIGCHSYNLFTFQKKKIKVATIDTMLSFYLAFLYANKPYYNQFIDRTLCMSQFLFHVQQKNRLEQKGLLKRFSITCYGHQEGIEEIKAEKAAKFKEFKNNKQYKKEEFEKWFLNYKPEEHMNIDENKKGVSSQTKTIQNRNKTKKKKSKNKSKNKSNKTNKKTKKN